MFKVEEIVAPRWGIMRLGEPIGLSVDTRCEVVEVRKRDKRVCVKREDGRGGLFWLDFDAVRKWEVKEDGSCR